jgi:hypothetical protein
LTADTDDDLGTIAQWGEVSKGKKDRSRSKAKESSAPAFGDSTNVSRPSRGGRGGFEGGRGGRGRGTDRGRGGKARGASVAHTNGSRKENIDPNPVAAWDTTETMTEDASKPTDATANTTDETSWGSSIPNPVAAVANAASSVIPAGVKKSWADMFKAETPAPKKASEPQDKYVILVPEEYIVTNTFQDHQNRQKKELLQKSLLQKSR